MHISSYVAADKVKRRDFLISVHVMFPKMTACVFMECCCSNKQLWLVCVIYYD